MRAQTLLGGMWRAGPLTRLATVLAGLSAVVIVPTPAGALTFDVPCASGPVGLIDAIADANDSPAAPDTINLQTGCVYSFTAST